MRPPWHKRTRSRGNMWSSNAKTVIVSQSGLHPPVRLTGKSRMPVLLTPPGRFPVSPGAGGVAPLQLRIAGCSTPPCQVFKGQSASMEVDFEAGRKSLTVYVAQSTFLHIFSQAVFIYMF